MPPSPGSGSASRSGRRSCTPTPRRPRSPGSDEAARFEQTFHIPAHELVLASGPGNPLLIVHGLPGAATERHQDRFLVGLFGAVLAIGSAVALAIVAAGLGA